MNGEDDLRFRRMMQRAFPIEELDPAPLTSRYGLDSITVVQVLLGAAFAGLALGFFLGMAAMWLLTTG